MGASTMSNRIDEIRARLADAVEAKLLREMGWER
jgi:hypothetical protein